MLVVDIRKLLRSSRGIIHLSQIADDPLRVMWLINIRGGYKETVENQWGDYTSLSDL